MPETRLLLVDDDRLILATLRRGLRQSGYRVETADSGEAALRIAAAQAFDLAILDMRMPGLSGAETAQRLREAHGLPALFLSAYGDIDLVRQAVTEGGLGYVVKPADIQQIIPAIEAALARARDLAALFEYKRQLETALAGGRYTNMAVGMVMAREGLDEQAAFDRLRQAARQQRRKLETYCQEQMAAWQGTRGGKASDHA